MLAALPARRTRREKGGLLPTYLAHIRGVVSKRRPLDVRRSLHWPNFPLGRRRVLCRERRSLSPQAFVYPARRLLCACPRRIPVVLARLLRRIVGSPGHGSAGRNGRGRQVPLRRRVVRRRRRDCAVVLAPPLERRLPSIVARGLFVVVVVAVVNARRRARRSLPDVGFPLCASPLEEHSWGCSCLGGGVSHFASESEAQVDALAVARSSSPAVDLACGCGVRMDAVGDCDLKYARRGKPDQPEVRRGRLSFRFLICLCSSCA